MYILISNAHNGGEKKYTHRYIKRKFADPTRPSNSPYLLTETVLFVKLIVPTSFFQPLLFKFCYWFSAFRRILCMLVPPFSVCFLSFPRYICCCCFLNRNSICVVKTSGSYGRLLNKIARRPKISRGHLEISFVQSLDQGTHYYPVFTKSSLSSAFVEKKIPFCFFFPLELQSLSSKLLDIPLPKRNFHLLFRCIASKAMCLLSQSI